MAKSKSFFGLRTGSTKSLTFQVYRGQQITKDRVYRVSNPRTEAQMRQRAIIPIVAASRAALKGLVDHSFEGVNYGNDSLKKFSEINLRSGALVVDSYAPNGFSNPGFASLFVSKGSLSDGGVKISTTEYNASGVFSYKINASKDLTFPAAKAGDGADAVLRALANWGATECEVVAPGNQLTFLTVSRVGNVKVGDNTAPISGFDINRILFPSTENTPAQIADVNGPWKLQLDVTEGANSVALANGVARIRITWDKEGGMLSFTVQPSDKHSSTETPDQRVFGGAVIRSAYVNDVWKRSNAQIVLSTDHLGKYTYEMWRSYYESTGVSAKYLNQGDEGTGIQG